MKITGSNVRRLRPAAPAPAVARRFNCLCAHRQPERADRRYALPGNQARVEVIDCVAQHYRVEGFKGGPQLVPHDAYRDEARMKVILFTENYRA